MHNVPVGYSIPESFVLIMIDENYHILSGWLSSYLTGDSWRLSTAIKHAKEIHENIWLVTTKSGSIYQLNLKTIGYSRTSEDMKNSLMKNESVETTVIEKATTIEKILLDFYEQE